MAGTLFPAELGLVLDPTVRRPNRQLLIGGAPIRVFRLTPAGADVVDRWVSGDPVGPGGGARALAARLVDAGIANPRPRPGGPQPSVAVVVPVRDDPDGLGATLASLAVTAPDVAVLVVDDGSEPPVARRPGRGRVRRLPVAGGPAAARNRG
ncbi:MAG: glycosyltransferase family 2 protein, partial [Acidimicrobiales bacterium]